MTDGPERTVRLVCGVPLEPVHRERLQQAGIEIVLEVDPADPPALERIAEANPDVWLGFGLDAGALAACPSLRWLQTATVGLESALFPQLVDAEVVVTNIPGRGTSTAKHALAMMLFMARALPESVRVQAAHEWRAPTPAEVISVAGATVIIVGAGGIGGEVARMARAFGMDVIGVSRTGAPSAAIPRMYPVDSLLEVVGQADWVVNVVPNTAAARQLFSAAVFRAMRPGLVFVNVGRGRTVDESAMAEALRTGQIRAAALDVFEDEPLDADSALWGLPNVVVNPHSAGVVAGSRSMDTTVQVFLRNLELFRNGALLPGVDKVSGY